jgi:ferredoxin
VASVTRGKLVMKDFPPPARLSLPLAGAQPRKGLRKGKAVAQGEVLAEAQGPFAPDLAAPLPGRVAGLDGAAVVLDVDFNAGAEPVEPARLKELGPVEAAKALRRMGIIPPPAPPPGEPVVISGFDPEPGLKMAATLWEDQRSALEDGLRLITRLYPGKPVVQCLPPGARPLANMDSAAVAMKLAYPWTLLPLLKKRLMRKIGRAAARAGKEPPYDPSARGVCGSRTLYLMGTALRTGRAPALMPVSLNGAPALVPHGMSAVELLALVNLRPRPGDGVVLGGLARGRSCARLAEGLGPGVEAVNLLKGGAPSASRLEGRCSMCGRCRAACPLRLPVDLIGGSPKRLWPLLLERLPQLASCPGCGLCALACPQNVPLAALLGAGAAS